MELTLPQAVDYFLTALTLEGKSPATLLWHRKKLTAFSVFIQNSGAPFKICDLTLQDGRLYSVDLNSGKSSVDQFEIDSGAVLPVVADSGHGPLFYTSSRNLGYLALAPNDRFQPHEPPLMISLAETNHLLLSWPSSFNGFALQQNSNLNTTNWVTLTNTPIAVGSQYQVTIPPPTGNQFYRLLQR